MSVAVPTWQIAAGIITFLVIYGLLIIVEFWLMRRYAQRLPEPERDEADRTLPLPAMSY